MLEGWKWIKIFVNNLNYTQTPFYSSRMAVFTFVMVIMTCLLYVQIIPYYTNNFVTLPVQARRKYHSRMEIPYRYTLLEWWFLLACNVYSKYIRKYEFNVLLPIKPFFYSYNSLLLEIMIRTVHITWREQFVCSNKYLPFLL